MSESPQEISAMDTAELKKSMLQLEQELRRREKEERLAKARELEKTAQAMGFVSLSEAARELSGLPDADRTRAIYVNPEDSTQIWTGRGRKPNWVHEYLRSGGKIEDLVPRD